MGDNTPCEVIGIESVKIKTHDGMTRTLTDVFQPCSEISSH
jgi:hypothetical protein